MQVLSNENNFLLFAFFTKASKTGVAGFEPTNGGVKVRSLTTWRHPKILDLTLRTKFIHYKRLGKKGFEPLTPWFVATCSSPLSYKPKI